MVNTEKHSGFTPLSDINLSGKSLLNIGINQIQRVGISVISAGVITVAGSYYRVDTEGSAASDDLDTINGGVIGQILLLESATSSRDTTVKHGTGNILLSYQEDYTLSTTNYLLVLYYNGSFWTEIGRRRDARQFPYVSIGETAPSSTPAKVGDIYVDTSTPALYYAKGTASSADWQLLTNG